MGNRIVKSEADLVGVTDAMSAANLDWESLCSYYKASDSADAFVIILLYMKYLRNEKGIGISVDDVLAILGPAFHHREWKRDLQIFFYGQWAPDDLDRMVFMLTFKDKRFVEFSCMMGIQLDEMGEEYKPFA